MTQQFHSTGAIENKYPHENLHMNVHSCKFIVAKGKQPKHPSTGEWINKMWWMHTVEYYSAIKRNGVLMEAVIGMDLKTFMLSEKRQM